jgi:hypothetical protein
MSRAEMLTLLISREFAGWPECRHEMEFALELRGTGAKLMVDGQVVRIKFDHAGGDTALDLT